MLRDVRSGKLERVGEALDQQWAVSGATYKHSQKVLINQSISLWKRAGYNRIRFLRWLFKAEGMSVEIDPEEWDLVKCMGAGAEKGCEMAGIESFDDAQAACAELRNLPAASGARFGLDDLICWLCLSQHKEAQARAKLPAPAEPVTADADLCFAVHGARTRLRRKVCHLPHAASGAPPQTTPRRATTHHNTPRHTKPTRTARPHTKRIVMVVTRGKLALTSPSSEDSALAPQPSYAALTS